jgi:hypothetical protein
VGIAWIADRTKVRMPYMVLNAVITLVGLLLTAYDKVVSNFPGFWQRFVDSKQNNGVRYFGILLGVFGCNRNLPTIITF